jgi:cytochrome c oxidase subunit 1
VAAPKGTEEFPVGEVHEDAEKTPLLLENWKIWIGLSVVLIVIAYTVPVIDIIENAPSSPGFKFW